MITTLLYKLKRLSQCVWLLLLTVWLICQFHMNATLPLSFNESQDRLVHLSRPVRVNGTSSTGDVTDYASRHPISRRHQRFASNNTIDRRRYPILSSTKGNHVSRHQDTLRPTSHAQTTTAMTTMTMTTTTILIPPEPDPNPLLNMALAWTDENGTEITSFGPKNPIHLLRRDGACPVTSQFKLIIPAPTHNHNRTNWKLSSLDIHGHPKTVGGDEFYVTYHDHSVQDPRGSRSPTAVAYVHDQGDGTYELDFHMSPYSPVPSLTPEEDFLSNNSTSSPRISGIRKNSRAGGTLTIALQYTCGVGMIPNNKKNSWGSGGLLGNIIYKVPVPTRPSSMTPFVEPNANKAIDLGKYQQVLVFGDSNMQLFSVPRTRFCQNQQQQQNSTQKCQMKYGTNVNAPLNRHVLKKRFLPRIRAMINETIQEEGYKLEDMALIVGSHAWDLIYDMNQRTQFLNHREAVDSLLRKIRKEFPTLDLYWRSAMAVHTHAATNVRRDDWNTIRPLYYLSTSRARKLYEYQTAIVSTNNVTHLDVYHASYLSAEYMGRGDARHFNDEWNEMATNWFYK